MKFLILFQLEFLAGYNINSNAIELTSEILKQSDAPIYVAIVKRRCCKLQLLFSAYFTVNVT